MDPPPPHNAAAYLLRLRLCDFRIGRYKKRTAQARRCVLIVSILSLVSEILIGSAGSQQVFYRRMAPAISQYQEYR